jgi:uncharacterized OsmC-like protein
VRPCASHVGILSRARQRFAGLTPQGRTGGHAYCISGPSTPLGSHQRPVPSSSWPTGRPNQREEASHGTTVRNGIDVEQLLDTIEATKADERRHVHVPRASTWEDGTHNTGTIGSFVHAGQDDTRVREPFTLTGDEPPVLLGDNRGPNAVELVLQALGFCYAVGYVANAAARGIDITRMDYEVEGTSTSAPSSGWTGPDRGSRSVRVRATVASPDATTEQLTELCEYVQETSPVRDIIANDRAGRDLPRGRRGRRGEPLRLTAQG